MYYTTLNKIQKYYLLKQRGYRALSFRKLLQDLNKTQPDDKPLSFLTILDWYGISVATWCLGVLPKNDLNLLRFKLKCARHVEHLTKSTLMKGYLDVLERYITANATKEELLGAAYSAGVDCDTIYSDCVANSIKLNAGFVKDSYVASFAANAVFNAVSERDAHDSADFAIDASADPVAEREYQTQVFKELFC